MAIHDRRERERADRRRLIIGTARKIAEAEGWDAVTTRRLSIEIEYSQPVIYKHFTGMEQIAEAIAIDGFAELAEIVSAAGTGAPKKALPRIAQAYMDFAHDNPAVYDAMFTRATTLHFATDNTPPALEAAFAGLRQVVAMVAGEQDADTLTEVFWSALHGLVTLTRTGRLRPDYAEVRLELLVGRFTRSQPKR